MTRPSSTARFPGSAARITARTPVSASSRRRFPNSPNRRHFTDCVLRPDEEYRHVSEFRFA